MSLPRIDSTNRLIPNFIRSLKSVLRSPYVRTPLLKNWKPTDFDALEKGVVLGQHGLADTGLFDDEHLAKIIDDHPNEDLTISTMGHDTNTFEWREGDRNGVAGADLLDLVRRGHLWLNCRKMLVHHPDVAERVHSLYEELEQRSSGFVARQRTANLLISSPDALVHYHVDLPVNMLWHLRGRKRVWVYPSFDSRFVSDEVLEMVCTGKLTEDVPYEAEFDRYALVYDVEPGQLLTWPQMTPHRVNNLDGLNVSLSTEHKNPRATRRLNVREANHWLRRYVGCGHSATEVDGVAAHAKQALARAVRFGQRLVGSQRETFTYQKTFKVDPSAPGGIVTEAEAPRELEAPHLAVS